MIRNVLYIDDQPDKREVGELEEELEFNVNEEFGGGFKVKVTPINPIDYIDFSVDKVDFKMFFDFLDKKYLSQTLDLVMCDFNIHTRHKLVAFHIIAHIRNKNKACSIILFTGSPLKELIRINNDDLAKTLQEHISEENKDCDIKLLSSKLEEIRKKENPAEEILSEAVTSNINDIVSRGGGQHEKAALRNIINPSFLLKIEHELLLHGDTIFNDGHKDLNGLFLKDVAKEVREQTTNGKYFTSLILELSMTNLINMNN